MRKPLFAVLLLATPTAVLAQAPQTLPPAGGMLASDTNGDGIVTRAEAIARAEATFAGEDADRDGTVTADERRAAREAMRAARGDAPPPRDGMGRGDDRSTTRADALMRAGQRFDRIDANHDGTLDAAELAAMRDRRGDRRGGEMPPPPAPPPAR